MFAQKKEYTSYKLDVPLDSRQANEKLSGLFGESLKFDKNENRYVATLSTAHFSGIFNELSKYILIAAGTKIDPDNKMTLFDMIRKPVLDDMEKTAMLELVPKTNVRIEIYDNIIGIKSGDEVLKFKNGVCIKASVPATEPVAQVEQLLDIIVSAISVYLYKFVSYKTDEHEKTKEQEEESAVGRGHDGEGSLWLNSGARPLGGGVYGFNMKPRRGSEQKDR
jgi:hypothetical protein